MQRYAIGIEFPGTQYRGWQTQQAGVFRKPLRKFSAKIANAPVLLHGAGRTDAGVHATNMVAHFDTEAVRPERGCRWVRTASFQRIFSIQDQVHG